MGDDRDPFGRRKDENPLASLGWQGDETASTVAEPARRRSPRGHDHAEPTAPASRRAVARLVKVVIVLAALIAVLGGMIGAVVDEGVERTDRFVDELAPPDVQAPSVPGSDADGGSAERAQPERVPRGLSTGSLLRPAAFGGATNRLRTGGYGRLVNLRVAPQQIDATLVTRDGRLRQVQIAPGGAVRVIGTTPAGFAGTPTMTFKGIVASAPSRLTRSAAGRLKQPASRVDYLVLSEFAGARRWNVYFEGGEIFSADSRGRITRRNS